MTGHGQNGAAIRLYLLQPDNEEWKEKSGDNNHVIATTD